MYEYLLVRAPLGGQSSSYVGISSNNVIYSSELKKYSSIKCTSSNDKKYSTNSYEHSDAILHLIQNHPDYLDQTISSSSAVVTVISVVVLAGSIVVTIMSANPTPSSVLISGLLGGIGAEGWVACSKNKNFSWVELQRRCITQTSLTLITFGAGYFTGVYCALKTSWTVTTACFTGAISGAIGRTCTSYCISVCVNEPISNTLVVLEILLGALGGAGAAKLGYTGCTAVAEQAAKVAAEKAFTEIVRTVERGGRSISSDLSKVVVAVLVTKEGMKAFLSNSGKAVVTATGREAAPKFLDYLQKWLNKLAGGFDLSKPHSTIKSCAGRIMSQCAEPRVWNDVIKAGLTPDNIVGRTVFTYRMVEGVLELVLPCANCAAWLPYLQPWDAFLQPLLNKSSAAQGLLPFGNMLVNQRVDSAIS